LRVRSRATAPGVRTGSGGVRVRAALEGSVTAAGPSPGVGRAVQGLEGHLAVLGAPREHLVGLGDGGEGTAAEDWREGRIVPCPSPKEAGQGLEDGPGAGAALWTPPQALFDQVCNLQSNKAD